jgi:LPXTG-motif cell wall-anchored protein
LGVGGGGSGSYGNSNTAGPATSGPVTVNAGGGNNTVMYVLFGILGFVGLVAILIFGRRK